jgi:hypothetical protein
MPASYPRNYHKLTYIENHLSTRFSALHYRGLDGKENRSTRNDNLSEIYTGNLKDKVYEMYKKDFQIFGYNKNLQNL